MHLTLFRGLAAGSLFVGGCFLSFELGRREAALERRPETAALRIPATVRSEDGRPLRSVPVAESTQRWGEASDYASALRGQWSALSGDRRFPALLMQRQGILEALARVDPMGALQLARRDGRAANDRAAYEAAALRGWAGTDANAALDWLIADGGGSDLDRLRAIVSGSAAQPAAAQSVFARLQRLGLADAKQARQLGFDVIAALAHQGHFEEAAAFASAGLDGSQAGWADSAYSQWARFDGPEAVSAALGLAEADLRRDAYGAAVAAWAEAEPAGLAEFAMALPAGDEQAFAAAAALKRWAATDPSALADWLGRRGSAPELDVGVIALATSPAWAEDRPRHAVGWAETIYDEDLRADTLAQLVQQWAATDRAGALEYIRSSGYFRPQDRHELLGLFGAETVLGIDSQPR